MITKLRDIISDIKSGDWGKDSLSDNYTEAVYCIRGADIPNINNGEKRILPSRFIKEKAAKTKPLSINNLVVEISGGSPTQSTGRIAFISNGLLSHYDKKIICSNFCKVIIPKNINPEYLYYYWKDLYNKGILFSYENGTTGIKNLDLNSFINEQNIWVPDPNTQQKIVQILKSLDDKIELNRRINANLEEQARGLFIELLNTLDNKRQYLLGDIIDIRSGKAIKSEKEGLYPVLGANGEIGRTNNYLFNDRLIFTGRVGTLGKVYRIEEKKVWLSDNTLIINPKIGYNFVYFTLKNTDLCSYNVGSTQPLIRQSDIKNIQIFLPTDEKLDHFENLCDFLFAEVNKNNDQNTILSSLRDTLLPKLMRGETNV